MKQRLFEQKNEITIPAADLEQANLMGFDRLELHLLDQAAVVIPGEMTARELIEVGESLLKLTFSLVDVLLESCSDCDNCGQQKPCAFMTDRWPGADGIFAALSRYAETASGTEDVLAQFGRKIVK